jgi:hypothetical protein
MTVNVTMQPPAGQSMPTQINLRDGSVIKTLKAATSVSIPSQFVSDMLAQGWTIVLPPP